MQEIKEVKAGELTKILIKTFPIDENKYFDQMFEFSNDTNVYEMLNILKNTEATRNTNDISILFGESNYLSMAPILLRSMGKFVILADIDYRIHIHTQYLLQCLQHSNNPDEFKQNYLNDKKNFLLNGRLELDLAIKKINLQETLKTKEDSLKEYYFLHNKESFMLCKQAIVELVIVNITLNLNNAEKCQNLANLLKQYNINIAFCNVTNIHEYDKNNRLPTSITKLLSYSPQCKIMYSSSLTSGLCDLEEYLKILRKTQQISYHYNVSTFFNNEKSDNNNKDIKNQNTDNLSDNKKLSCNIL